MAEDPVRLQEANSSLLVRSLIKAGRGEQPRAALFRHTLIAMGASAQHAATLSVASSTSLATSTSAAAKAAGTAGTAALSSGAGISLPLLAAKWLSLGLVGGALAVSAASKVDKPTSVGSRVSVRAQNPTPAPVAPSAPPMAQKVAQVEEPARATLVRPARPRPAVPAAPLASVDHGSGLAAEIAVLDRARRAISAGNGAQARQLLGKYEIDFPEARMLPEALFLRLEAATLEGDPSAAAAAAQQILRSYPGSPHVARARNVLGLD